MDGALGFGQLGVKFIRDRGYCAAIVIQLERRTRGFVIRSWVKSRSGISFKLAGNGFKVIFSVSLLSFAVFYFHIGVLKGWAAHFILDDWSVKKVNLYCPNQFFPVSIMKVVYPKRLNALILI